MTYLNISVFENILLFSLIEINHFFIWVNIYLVKKSFDFLIVLTTKSV